MNLQSTVNKIGKTTTQIIHFSGGSKKTFSGIISSSWKQGEFSKADMTNGSMLMVNTKNVDCIEVFPEKTK